MLKSVHDFHPKNIFYFSSVSSEIFTTTASDVVTILTTAKGIFKHMINVKIASIVVLTCLYSSHSHRHSYAHSESYSHSVTNDDGRSQCSSSCSYTCCTGATTTNTGDRCGGGGCGLLLVLP